jgi:hypothetical protein
MVVHSEPYSSHVFLWKWTYGDRTKVQNFQFETIETAEMIKYLLIRSILMNSSLWEYLNRIGALCSSLYSKFTENICIYERESYHKKQKENKELVYFFFFSQSLVHNCIFVPKEEEKKRKGRDRVRRDRLQKCFI